MHSAVLKARPFDCEEDAISAILSHKIQPGDAVIIRYEGPKGQRHAGDVLHYGSHLLRPGAFRLHCAADGRTLFLAPAKARPSATSPREAAAGGPIALVEENDLIEIDIPKRVLRICGVQGERKKPAEIELILDQRRSTWKPREPKYKTGVLGLFTANAASPMKGSYMD